MVILVAAKAVSHPMMNHPGLQVHAALVSVNLTCLLITTSIKGFMETMLDVGGEIGYLNSRVSFYPH